MRNILLTNSRFITLLVLLPILFIASLVLIVCRSQEDRPPNVILVMTDDQGYGDIGSQGSGRISTN